MPVAAYTNFDISNVYKGNNTVSKIMKGNVHAWPPSPAFSFSTYRSGGDLNFTVTSDTDYIACTVNDSDVFIYKTSGTTANNIYAYDTLHQLESVSKVINVSLPLYERKYVRISGTGTQLARYGRDYNNGRVVIEIVNQFGSNISYTVNLTGKSSITKTCPVGTTTSFIFTSVPKGTRTVTLNNLSDGSTTSTQVVINTKSAPISIQNLTLGLNNTTDNSTSTTLNDIKVYSITEEEALNSIHGTAPVISVEQIYDGKERGYRTTTFKYRIVFRIVSGGSRLPVNSNIAVRWDHLTNIRRTWGSQAFDTRVLPVNIVTLVTDSVGRVVQIKKGTEMTDDPVIQAALPSGWAVMTSLPKDTYFHDNSWTVHNNSRITVNVKSTGLRYYRDRNDAQDLAADFAAAWIVGGSSGITFIGTNEPINLVTHTKFENININDGTWAKNLLFNNKDLVGNLQAVELKNVNVQDITSTSQRELKVIQSNYINTTTNKNGNSNVQITNTPNFEAMHGAGVTYNYINGSWPVGFNPLLYMQFYSDLMSAYGPSNFEGAWYHYKTWGVQNGRTHSTDFLAQDYLDLHADLRAAYGSTGGAARLSAMLHWLNQGKAEGRRGRK